MCPWASLKAAAQDYCEDPDLPSLDRKSSWVLASRTLSQELLPLLPLAYPLCHALPLAQTLVVTSTFSLPSRKRSITAALCSTIISPLSNAT